jgi:predicted GTPase
LYKILISYSWVNSAERAAVVSGLSQIDGLSILSDREFIRRGESVHQRILEMIGAADCIVVFLTEEGLRSPEVRDELSRAHDRDKIIIAVVAEGTPLESLPWFIRDLNWIPYNERNFDSVLTQLVESLRQLSAASVLPETLPRTKRATDIDAELLAQLREEFKAQGRRKFTFLLVGRAGVGKSSTLNTLLGKYVSKVSPFKPGTKQVTRHESAIHGIRFSIVDTPGLGDAEVEKGNDEAYLADIKRSVSRIDCLWFVVNLTDQRLRADEMRTIRLISEAYGNKVWERAVIVFTFADRLTKEELPYFLDNKTILIRNEIAKHSGKLVARKIPAVAVANGSNPGKPAPPVPRLLPNGEPWLGDLYTEVFTKISDEGALPFYLVTANRVATPGSSKKNGEIALKPPQKEKIAERIRQHPILFKVASYLEKAENFFREAGSLLRDLFGF